MIRSRRITSGDPLIPGVREITARSDTHAVPRTDTGALAEKAKTCKAKLVKGIRHIWSRSFGRRDVYSCLLNYILRQW